MDQMLVDRIFSFAVDSENTSYSRKFTLEKNVKLVHGILLSSNNPKLLFYRGSQRIELSGDELFPEEFESKLLMSGISVAPDNKYRALGNGVLAGNGELKVRYQDTSNVNAAFEEYKVIIVLRCELA